MKKVLVLDGGGGKAVYTIGVLFELEQYLQLHCTEPRSLYSCFDIFFGTSSGGIICTGLASGLKAQYIYAFYRETLKKIMSFSAISKVTPRILAKKRSEALRTELAKVFFDYPFDYINKSLALYCTDFIRKIPRVFYTDMLLEGASELVFTPGFGATIVDGLLATSAAYPIFDRVHVKGRTLEFEAVDGAYYANNPSLFALDALRRGYPNTVCKILNIGVGSYIEPNMNNLLKKIDVYNLLDLVLEVGSHSHVPLIQRLSSDTKHILRINDSLPIEADFFVHEYDHVEEIFTYGRKSFLNHQKEILSFLEIESDIL